MIRSFDEEDDMDYSLFLLLRNKEYKNEIYQINEEIKQNKNVKKLYGYNKERNFDINDYENISPDMDFMNVKAKFYIEKLEKLGKYGEGLSFNNNKDINNYGIENNIKRNNFFFEERENKHKILSSLSQQKDKNKDKKKVKTKKATSLSIDSNIRNQSKNKMLIYYQNLGMIKQIMIIVKYLKQNIMSE